MCSLLKLLHLLETPLICILYYTLHLPYYNYFPYSFEMLKLINASYTMKLDKFILVSAKLIYILKCMIDQSNRCITVLSIILNIIYNNKNNVFYFRLWSIFIPSILVVLFVPSVHSQSPS